jgi:hypothetical protein
MSCLSSLAIDHFLIFNLFKLDDAHRNTNYSFSRVCLLCVCQMFISRISYFPFSASKLINNYRFILCVCVCVFCVRSNVQTKKEKGERKERKDPAKCVSKFHRKIMFFVCPMRSCEANKIVQRLNTGQDDSRILDGSFDLTQESHSLTSINQAVIVRKCDVHHGTNDDLEE